MQQQQQQATVVNVGGQPYVQPGSYVVGTQQSNIVEKYNKQQSLGLGITLIVAAVLSFIFNIVDLAIGHRAFNEYSYYSYNYFTWGDIGHGFWVGIMCLIAGGFGVGAGMRKTKCQIVSFNVLCIIAATFTIGQLVVGILGAALNNEERQRSSCSLGSDRYNQQYCDKFPTLVAMEALLACLAIVEAVAAIWGSAICCKAYCCCGCCNCCCCQTIPDYRMQPVMYNGTHMMVITSNQQSFAPTMYPVQPPGYFYPSAQPSAAAVVPQPMYSQANAYVQQPYSAATPAEYDNTQPPKY